MSADRFPSTRFIKFVWISPMQMCLSRIGIGADESGTVDLSQFIPRTDAKYAIILPYLSPHVTIPANLLDVEENIYEADMIDAYGYQNLMKLAGVAQMTYPASFPCLMLLKNCRYAYEISGIWNGQTVTIQHFILGYIV